MLYVLTTDSPAAVADHAENRGLQSPIATVDRELWARWGIANPKKPRLPHPTTLVVSPDGTVLRVETHENYRERTDPAEIVAQLGALVPPENPPTAPSKEPDWEHAARLSATQTATGAQLSLEIQSGFHAYGTRETIGRPLAVRVDGHPEAKVPIPTGEIKVLGGGQGETWVLEGTVILDVAVQSTGPLTGELDLQLCTDTSCSRPTTWNWSAE
jgi:hypothetical protein